MKRSNHAHSNIKSQTKTNNIEIQAKQNKLLPSISTNFKMCFDFQIKTISA